ncbi:hypothetical protein AB0O22_19015 [Streptomyces sp. NPDC091204]|uniref:hypothetical protein n=1 Tax=Streptomyces sp. NPDC091204 TaxID=3155299 RepID=UPI00343EB54A
MPWVHVPDAAGRRSLFGTLLRAGQRWSSVRRPEGIDVGRLVIVISCDPASVADLREELRKCQEAMLPAGERIRSGDVSGRL